MIRILCTKVDGSLCIIVPAKKSKHTLEGIIARSVPTGATDVVVVDTATIPTDRTFRNAWRHSSGVISTEMGKAYSIAQERVREARTPKLAKLDVEFMQALEQRAPTAAITAKKDALRNATADTRLNAATHDTLKAAMEQIISEIDNG